MNSYQVLCLSESLAPITHASGSAGNESLLMRETAITPRGAYSVPCLSGNALRHSLVRAPGARWLVDEYGLAGKLTLEQLAFLFHGGALTRSAASLDVPRAAQMHRLWPLLRLLGGCLPDQILAGALACWRGTLVCEENAESLSLMLAAFDGYQIPECPLRPAEDFVGRYQYARFAELPVSASDGEPGSAANMLIAGQTIVRGAYFLHGFSARHVTQLELGALAWSLELWQRDGGTIGGMAARGHGRLRTSLAAICDGQPLDHDRLCGAAETYCQHARSVRDEALAWLNAAFAGRDASAASHRPRRARRGASSEPADAPDPAQETA